MTDDDETSSDEAEATEDAPASEPPASEPPAKKPEKPARKRAEKPAEPPRAGLFPLPRGKAHALAFLSGFLYFLAFPGVELWPLAFFAWVPLIIALRGQHAGRGAALGWTAGFTMTMCGFYWLLEMLKTFSGFATPLCLLFMAILCGYQAGRIALHGYLATRAELRGWPAGVAFTVAFVASELTFPLLFPWSYAATVHQVPALVQLADLGGPIAVGLMLVAANLAVAELIFARLEKRAVRRRIVGALVAVPAIALLYGAVRIAQVDARVAAAPKARIGLVQANMSLMAKRHERNEGLYRHVALTRELEREGKLDLVVWSETSVMAPQDEEIAPSVYRSQFAASLGTPALFGAVLVRQVPDVRGYVLYNSALLSDQSGAIVGRYDKQYLLAFGEYLPLGDQFPELYEISRNSGRFTPGNTLKPLPLNGHGIATFICYEDIIPSFVRSIVRSGDTDLLVNITNDAWFGDSTEPWIHLALAQLRAVEHRRFLARSTNSGVSAIVDPVGRVTVHSGTFKKEAVAGEIAWLRATTGYELWGDWPWWLTTLCAVVLAIRDRRGHVRPRPAKKGRKE